MGLQEESAPNKGANCRFEQKVNIKKEKETREGEQ